MGSSTCQRCGGPIIEIELVSGDAPLVMRSCSHCDVRDWSTQGREIDLSEVLHELSASAPSRRRKT